MFEFLFTLLLASAIMIVIMGIGVGLTMPFHGALVRLRSNYNPRAVGLEGAENRVGPTLHTLLATLKRTKRLEGWWGLYKGAYPTLIFTTLISLASIIFVGGSSTRGPKGVYSVPEAGGVRMGIFTVILTLISLPMIVIINRSIITPYKLPMSPTISLRAILSAHEIAQPWLLYLAPGLLITTFLHSLSVTLIARSVRLLILGAPVAADIYDASWWRWLLFIIYQALATLWLTPLEVLGTRLSIQPNLGGEVPTEDPEGATPEGLSFAGTEEDVIGLRPTTEPYEGALDCARKIIEEEGWQSLYRGWWWTAGGNIVGVFA